MNNFNCLKDINDPSVVITKRSESRTYELEVTKHEMPLTAAEVEFALREYLAKSYGISFESAGVTLKSEGETRAVLWWETSRRARPDRGA